MARIVKPVEEGHTGRLRCDRNDGQMVLVGRGRNAYLWVGSDAGKPAPVTTYSGRVALRKFAQIILDATA
ncbi:MAG TPA: hypothetical protein VFN69_04470 [Rudaea sp.]|nr:hypothetical protein [Rudaea sp.]